MSHADTDVPLNDPVMRLLGPRGRVSAVAGEMRCSVQTVHSWKRKGSVPPWRRSAVLDAVRRLNLDLAPEVLVYLTQAV